MGGVTGRCRLSRTAARGLPSRCAELLPLDIGVVGSAGEDAALFRSLIAQYHYLGVRSAAGENLKYLVRDRRGRLLGCLWFAAAAWRCKARDRFIGWDEQARQRNLPCVANNTRFLVLPWVRVDNLASHLLSRLAGRISRDWKGKYGHGLYALGDLRGPFAFHGGLLPGSQLAAGWTDDRPDP